MKTNNEKAWVDYGIEAEVSIFGLDLLAIFLMPGKEPKILKSKIVNSSKIVKKLKEVSLEEEFVCIANTPQPVIL